MQKLLTLSLFCLLFVTAHGQENRASCLAKPQTASLDLPLVQPEPGAGVVLMIDTRFHADLKNPRQRAEVLENFRAALKPYQREVVYVPRKNCVGIVTGAKTSDELQQYYGLVKAPYNNLIIEECGEKQLRELLSDDSQ